MELSDEDREAFKRAHIRLCECNGDSVFRGKLYAGVVMRVTGVDLYEAWIPPAVVRSMAKKLEECDAVMAAALENASSIRPEDVHELARFFRLCGDRGLGLVSSW
jgi:hypothetical protein